MTYDPFARGPHPVGVRSVELHDAGRGRTLPVEIWYPATAEYAGRDLDDASRDHYAVLPSTPDVSQDAVRDAEPLAGPFPLIAFSHGSGGHRRQTTHLCSHFASHGYAVAAPDHVGNTVLDQMELFTAAQTSGAEPDPNEFLRASAGHRPPDLRLVIDRVLAGEAGLPAAALDPDRVGASGHSFGGWTVLMAAQVDSRIRALLPLAPAGGKTPLPGAEVLSDALDFGPGRAVPTLYLVAERDTLLPLEGMLDLVARTPEPRRVIVLRNADHMHFCDRVEEAHEMFRLLGKLLQNAPTQSVFAAIVRRVPPIAELCPGAQAYPYLQGLGLAHFDACLRERPEAQAFLAGDLRAAVAARGVEVDLR